MTAQEVHRLPLMYRLLYIVAISSGGTIAGAFHSHHILLWMLSVWIPGMVFAQMSPDRFGAPDIRHLLLRPFRRS